MATLVIIRGNSGSGKTSLAHSLQKELGENTLLLSQDLLRRTMLQAHDGFDTPTVPLLLNLLDYGFNHHQTTILEGILKSDWYQPVWQRIIERYGLANTYAYYYDLPFYETLKRHNTRDKANEFGEDALKRWWVEKDYLADIPETKLTKTLSLEVAKTLILSDLKKS
ncbi:AAA family ATPase [Streptococcus halotolerans]|uniref:AAA family ATPase n=1 Tax=Streptococcus halotolerans TaxID=1814128 RepID=UPI00078912EF|nr:AAA family ATPase [Streptococcus halotolerans]